MFVAPKSPDTLQRHSPGWLRERGTFKINSGNKHAQTITHDNRIAKISISDFKVFKTI